MTEDTDTDTDTNEDYKHLIDKLKQMHPDDIKDALDLASGQYDEIFEDHKKLTTAPHEILIKVNANILEQNEKGEYIGSKGMFEQNYHIPVPTGTICTEYVDAFFGFVKQALIDTITKTEDTANPTKDDQNA